MAKTANDVLAEMVKRGYLTQIEATEGEAKYLSFISQAKDAILAYCNIPLAAAMPDGLFYAWVDIADGTAKGKISIEGTGEIKSITEGDTTIQYDVGVSTVKGSASPTDYINILKRFRRLP